MEAPSPEASLSRKLAPYIIMVLALAAALAIYFNLFGSGFMAALAGATAKTTGWALRLLGNDISTSGTVVGANDFAFDIVAECTALGPVVLYAGAVLAYPSSIKAKIMGLAMGVSALLVINLVRLVTLFYIGRNFPNALDVFHLLVWQSLIILSAILLWLLWVERFARVPKR